MSSPRRDVLSMDIILIKLKRIVRLTGRTLKMSDRDRRQLVRDVTMGMEARRTQIETLWQIWNSHLDHALSLREHQRRSVIPETVFARTAPLRIQAFLGRTTMQKQEV